MKLTGGLLFGRLLVALSLVAGMPAAVAQLNIGVNLSVTGAGASQGIPQRDLIALLPKTLAGQPVQYLLLDNATDPTTSVRNARKLVAESRIDALINGSTTPTALAASEVAFESKTPMLSLAPVAPPADRAAWVFQMPQTADLMIDAVAEYMKANGVKTVGYIGYADPWGDLVYKSIAAAAKKYDLTLVNDERYQRTDTSVTPQALKSVSLKPDAMLIGAAGTPAALPHLALLERGYTGKIFHTHGVVNNDFLRIGGKQIEGALAPIGPVVVFRDLPDDNPVKKVSGEFIRLYEKAYGPGPVNAFATWAYDAYLLLERGVQAALATGARPGTPEFRVALRDAIEQKTGGLVGTNGVYNLTATDHSGLDKRARVMVRVQNGGWVLAR
ncbi:MAG TPA: ABC transporter substrate-binding protein [Burkholderiaceae bacterium]|nr:ABC transporter substrate-binding protein [Burkholderiaceae bacterium]